MTISISHYRSAATLSAPWLRFASEWALIVAAVLAAHWSLWLALPAAWLIGTRQHALAVIGHMASHRLCGRGSEALAWLAFAPMGGDLRRYRSLHLAHHRAISDPATDVEVELATRFAERWRAPRARDTWLDLFGPHADEVAWIVRSVATLRSLSIMGALLAVVALTAGILPVALWLAALPTGFAAAQRLRARTEHDHLNAPGLTKPSVQPSMLQRFLYLPHGTWMHAEHHAHIRG
ncbi:MAG TPA: fatty acid desaturase [Rubrivivax sp.]|nr:fatty acid desaturase [Rubrivivax sp.]HRY86472.1 fatty acid desaturase [Rubrivivax sp.]